MHNDSNRVDQILEHNNKPKYERIPQSEISDQHLQKRLVELQLHHFIHQKVSSYGIRGDISVYNWERESTFPDFGAVSN